MNALREIEQALLAIGYPAEALMHDYRFADVLAETPATQSVRLAAFTQTPESFRSAAFGVVEGGQDPQAAVMARRALGAPVFFTIDDLDIGVWSVGAHAAPRLIERVPLSQLDALFARYQDRWAPQALHRAKSTHAHDREPQFDFIDLGLLPAIEEEVRIKLHDAMSDVVSLLLPAEDSTREAEKAVFRITFRLLAAKILADREHPASLDWRRKDVAIVLAGIERYYRLDDLSADAALVPDLQIRAAWERLGSSINLRNISSDSLAFVYENTLVTADTRKLFGTHSTPRTVAEYVIGQIDLAGFDLKTMRIVEPFTGAGIFLVAALHQLRDLLPAEWSPSERHAFLVQRLHGAELDVFAGEVAKLSLILADYPNANGWNIRPLNLFAEGALAELLSGATVVLCNPPFEDFNQDERKEYPDAFNTSTSKAAVALHAAIDAAPEAIGFVLPRGFLQQNRYQRLRERLAAGYGRIELVSLPDRVFEKATYPCALVIATNRRDARRAETVRLTSRLISDHDRLRFLRDGDVSAEHRAVREASAGNLWVGALDAIWDYLANRTTLGDHADVYRGLQWRVQREGVRQTPGPMFERGVYRPADSLQPFRLFNPVWLSVDSEVNLRPAPLTRPWQQSKVLINNQRLSRGPWRLSAAIDRSGLLASQQFTGVWPKGEYSVESLAAIFNGPLANAYVTEHSTDHDFTNVMLRSLPLPNALDHALLREAVNKYEVLLQQNAEALLGPDLTEPLNRALLEIDALVLKGYDLPPRLERQLFGYFDGARRPTSHAFSGWLPDDFKGYIPLHEWLAGAQQANRGAWILDVFTPAPEAEIDAVARFLG